MLISYFLCEDCNNAWGIAGVNREEDKCGDCDKVCPRITKVRFIDWQVSVGHRTPNKKK